MTEQVYNPQCQDRVAGFSFAFLRRNPSLVKSSPVTVLAIVQERSSTEDLCFMAKEIPLTQGQVAIVDDEDYELVNQYKWHARRGRYTWYAARAVRSGERGYKGSTSLAIISLHRFIIGNTAALQIDHRNRNGLDNQRKNLRVSTVSQNLANRARPRHNTSGYKGILRSGKNWCAQIRFEHKCYCLGTFGTPEEAARAYDQAAKNLHGEFAMLNFPKEKL